MNQQDEELRFKGMRRFRYKNRDDLLKDAKRGPHFWWWNYLRISKDYWWACQRKGLVDDPRLRSMHRDFGDVYSMTFDQWWNKRGIGLFYEQMAMAEVRALDKHKLELTRGSKEHLLLEIPLHLTEKTIISQVRKYLRQHPQLLVERISHAERKLAKLIGIRQDVIEVAYQVWQLHFEHHDSSKTYAVGETQGSKSLYQLGKELRLVKSCMPAATDDAKKAAMRVNGMKVAVSRMLARANNLAVNAGVGVFPSVQAPAEPISWKRIPQQRMDEAIAKGLWRPLFNENEVLNVQQLDDGLLI
jgi:hypothetical protein